MKKLLCLFLLVGCVSTTDKETIAKQAARLNRAVVLIQENKMTQGEEEAFIKGERKIWCALNYSINDVPLPADLIPVESSK